MNIAAYATLLLNSCMVHFFQFKIFEIFLSLRMLWKRLATSKP